jgi:ubiquitin carboxyl-terminal hydrolase L5
VVQLSALEGDLKDRKDRREKGRQENIRRRHNYIPLVIALMRALAAKGKLTPAVEAAKARQAQRKDAKDGQKAK